MTYEATYDVKCLVSALRTPIPSDPTWEHPFQTYSVTRNKLPPTAPPCQTSSLPAMPDSLLPGLIHTLPSP